MVSPSTWACGMTGRCYADSRARGGKVQGRSPIAGGARGTYRCRSASRDLNATTLAGRADHAKLLTSYLNETSESACMVTRPGATARTTSGGLAGEAAGARIARQDRSDERIAFDGNGWLALGRSAFTLVYRDLRRNRP